MAKRTRDHRGGRSALQAGCRLQEYGRVLWEVAQGLDTYQLECFIETIAWLLNRCRDLLGRRRREGLNEVAGGAGEAYP